MPGRFNPDDYVDCQERINRFWEENPDGAILTEVTSDPNIFEQIVIRALVFKQRPFESRATAMPDATGIAAETRGNGANATSWHENAETSAIGRALANMGYATSRKDRPSRQEMQKVERNEQAENAPRTRTTSQNTVAFAIKQQLDRIAVLKEQKGVTAEGLRELTGKASANDLTLEEANRLIAELLNWPDIILDVPEPEQGELVAAGDKGAPYR